MNGAADDYVSQMLSSTARVVESALHARRVERRARARVTVSTGRASAYRRAAPYLDWVPARLVDFVCVQLAEHGAAVLDRGADALAAEAVEKGAIREARLEWVVFLDRFVDSVLGSAELAALDGRSLARILRAALVDAVPDAHSDPRPDAPSALSPARHPVRRHAPPALSRHRPTAGRVTAA